MIVRSGVLILTLLAAQGQAAKPAPRATQRFVVHVPPKATIVAPRDVALVHDGTDAPQAFPPQNWQVTSTFPSGLTVDFSTQTAFQSRPTVDAQRDVRLGLTVGAFDGPATWAVVVARDQSQYATGDSTALVRAESDGPGRADLMLEVLFLTGDRSALPSGDFGLTVTATLSPNP